MQKTLTTGLVLGSTALIFAGCHSHESQRTSAVRNQPAPSQQSYAQNDQWYAQDNLTGPRGPQGPAGARGERGPMGLDGAAGYAVAGERGNAGPAGPRGPEGSVGARGPAGQIVRGPIGDRGQAGDAGLRGRAGPTGERGASADGYAGPSGPAGPEGPRGPRGDIGARGDTLVGPAGAAGRDGPAGERGEAGQTGQRGQTTAGLAGPRGPAGPAGPQGGAGQIGPVGPTGLITQWASYREFWFDQNRDSIHNADRYLFEQIASYMRNNPSLELGLEGTSASGSSSWGDQNETENRVRNIRSGLIAAGVPADRISNVSIANRDQLRDDRVVVLLRTTDGYVESSSEYANRIESQGERGTVSDWTTFHTFSFDANETNTHPADRERFNDVVDFMERNPNMRLAISSSPQASDRALARERSNVVRDALIDAGVESSRISIGEFGNGRMSRDGRLEVLVMTDRAISQGR